MLSTFCVSFFVPNNPLSHLIELIVSFPILKHYKFSEGECASLVSNLMEKLIFLCVLDICIS